MTEGLPANVGVHLIWTTVTSSDDGDWYFKANQKISQGFRCRIRGPRIYRFVISPPSSDSLDFVGNLEVYVGESEHFERRCANYKGDVTKIRKPPQPFTGWLDPKLVDDLKEMESDPCVRIAAHLQNAELDGSKVELQFLEFAEFWIDRIQLTPAKMNDLFFRRLIENLAILSTDGPNVTLLNRCRNPRIKQKY